MSNFEQEQKKQLRRNASEGKEAGFENKESREAKEDKEMGAKERMEQTAVEVKNTKQRMQNIMVNMQQVIQAVQQIRKQLGLDESGDVPALQTDQKTLDELKQKLAGLEDQMDDLRLALKNEETAQLRQANPGMSDDELNKQVEKKVSEVLEKLGIK